MAADSSRAWLDSTEREVRTLADQCRFAAIQFLLKSRERRQEQDQTGAADYLFLSAAWSYHAGDEDFAVARLAQARRTPGYSLMDRQLFPGGTPQGSEAARDMKSALVSHALINMDWDGFYDLAGIPITQRPYAHT